MKFLRRLFTRRPRIEPACLPKPATISAETHRKLIRVWLLTATVS